MKKLRSCKICGRLDNLHVQKSGKILSACEEHLTEYSKRKHPAKKECLICGTKENLVKIGNNTYNSCESHYEEYKILVNDKKKEKSLLNYGVEHPMNSDEVKNRLKETFIKNIGVDNPSKLKGTRDKAKKTMKERFGFEYASQSDELCKRRADNNFVKYGKENVLDRKS